MKYFLLYFFSFLFISPATFGSEINFLKVELFDHISKFEFSNDIKLDTPKKCKKNNCEYLFKYEIPKDNIKYFTNYRLETNKKKEIINIVGIYFDKESLQKPENFSNKCSTGHISWNNDYNMQKYDKNNSDFVEIYSEGISSNPAEFPNVLYHQSKLYLDEGKKIFESNCKFSRSDDSNWIISVATTKLMTKDYHDAFEKNYPKKRIKKFDFNQIKSYLFSSGF